MPDGRPQAPAVYDLDDRVVDPLSGDGAPAVVLIFVRQDCPISNRYAPEIHRLYKQFASGGVRFVLVYPNPDATAKSIRRHLSEFAYECEAVRDPNHVLVARSQTKITPEAAVFTPRDGLVYHGRIDDLYVDFGQARPEPTRRELEDVLHAVLAGEPAPVSTAPAVGCFIQDLQ